MMLSRVAERLYWMARYLERAEDTARLTYAYTHLVLDIPRGAEPGWDTLVRIQNAEQLYAQHYRVYNERNVLGFLIADRDNVGGIYPAIRAARENVRTTRDALPEEAWEYVNELYLYAKENAENSVGRRNRYDFLETIISRCQMINGMLISTLPRDRAYSFTRLGRLLERADMTTRILDVGAEALMREDSHYQAVDPLIWASLLRSLSAMGAYRSKNGPQVRAGPAVDLVLRDDTLPRSMKYCLNGMRAELRPLKNHQPALKLLDQARRKLARFDPQEHSRQDLHEFIDKIQACLIAINAAIAEAWFIPPESE